MQPGVLFDDWEQVARFLAREASIFGGSVYTWRIRRTGNFKEPIALRNGTLTTIKSRKFWYVMIVTVFLIGSCSKQGFSRASRPTAQKKSDRTGLCTV